MAPIHVDETKWPWVSVRYPASFNDEEWKKHSDALAALFQRRTKFVLLSDASLSPIPTATQRKFAAERISELRHDWSTYCMGMAFVSPSALVRGVMTAINWASPPPFPQRMFASVDQAEDWLRARRAETMG